MFKVLFIAGCLVAAMMAGELKAAGRRGEVQSEVEGSSLFRLLINRLAAQKRAVCTATPDPTACTPEYAAMKDKSTMCCENRDPAAKNSGVSEADIATIISKHNEYRSNVSPPATNMVKMYWDERIAEVAQFYATTCPSGHDKWSRDVVGITVSIMGQNMARGYDNWATAVNAWHAEVKHFVLGTGAVPAGKAVGHYTQVVRDHAVAVGCGYAECGSRTYVCNYAYGQSDYTNPYTAGEACSECGSEFCKDNLCDCGNKICMNQGTLNLQTCQCDCRGQYYGDNCESIDCSTATDGWMCSQYAVASCDKYWNVPLACPFKCGICTAAKRNLKEVKKQEAMLKREEDLLQSIHTLLGKRTERTHH